MIGFHSANRTAKKLSFGFFALLLALPAARAADFNFSGTLTADDDQKSFFFQLAQGATVRLATSSYATGGFDPTISVFDGDGNLIANNRDGGCANVGADPTTGYCWDAFLSLVLPAGSYQVVITQSENVASGPTLADAFIYSGQGNFTGGGGFFDQSGAQRSAGFSVAIGSVTSAIAQLAVAPQSLPNGKVTTSYSYQFTSNGGTAPTTWSLQSGTLPGGLTLSAGGLLSGTPNLFGTYSFTLQASDGSSPPMTATQSFQVTILPQDLKITSTSLPTWVTGFAFSRMVNATGGYTPLTFSMPTPGTAGLTIAADGTLSGTQTTPGNYNVPVQVTDAHGTVVQATLSWQVNAPTKITSSAALPPGITGRSYTGFTFNAVGGANPVVAWSVAPGSALPAGLILSAAGSLQGTPVIKANYSFVVQASDGVFPVTQTVALNVYDLLLITTSTLPNATVGQAYGPVQAQATGGSGILSWSGSGVPAGLSVLPSGELSGNPVAGGVFNVTLLADDNSASQRAQVTIPLTIVYPTLTITSNSSLGGAAMGSVIARTVTATGGKLPYAFSLSGAPAWLNINASTGMISGAAGAPGDFTFSVIVTDSLNTVVTQGASLTVLGITTTSLAGANTNAAYSARLSALGGTPPYSWSGSGVPAGMSLASDGTLSGTPTSGGSTNIFVTVTDKAGLSASTALSLTIQSTGPLKVLTSQLGKGQVNNSFTDSVSASGGTPPYSWAVSGGALPPGLSLGNTGAITGTPTLPGTYTFGVAVTDATKAMANSSVSVTITPQPLSLSANLPAGIVGSDYPQQILSPSGGTGNYTMSVSGGSLPPGLTLSSGVISGIPDTAGFFGFTLSVTDSASPPVTFQAPLSILIKPAQADLILSSGSVSLSLNASSTDLPEGANVTIRSSVLQQLLNYGVSVSSSAPWLDVTSIGQNTPGSISVALNSAALSLNAGSYTASVSVNCMAPSPCSGRSQSIPVSLMVTGGPPKLQLSSALLAFVATRANPAPAQSFVIQNKGGGSLAITSVKAADGWLSVSGAPTVVLPGPGNTVTVSPDTSGLTPGFYRSSITVTTSAGSATIPVTVQYTVAGSLTLSPSGSQFTTQVASLPGNPGGSFAVVLSGAPSLSWSAAVQNGSAWLKLNTPTGLSSLGSPGSVSYSIDSAALAPGTYYDSVVVSSDSAVNSPVNYTVVLNVTPNTVPPTPDPQPAGLVFLTTAGAPAPGGKVVQVYTSSKAPIGYQASATTEDGAGWLSVTPVSGMTSASNAAQTTISVAPGTMPVGVYRGGVSYALSSAAVRTVNVTLVISPAQATTTAPLTSDLRPAAGCTASSLVPTQTGLVSNFAQPAAWPTPLSIRLVDNCGTSIVNGQVYAGFSNGDPLIALRTADASGVYTGTWTPRGSASQVTITAKATATGYPATTAQITGQVTPNAAPVLTPNATLHVFAPLVGGALGPGNIIQIYGQNLSGQASLAQTVPLPTNLGGTSVLIGGERAPLYYASATQINAEIPFDLQPNKTYQIIVVANGAFTTPDSLHLNDVSPGIAAFASGAIIAQHGDYSLVLDSSPAKPGEVLTIYLAGLGSTDVPVPTGSGAPLDQLVHPSVPPTLTLNGKNVPLLFAGLTPGLVGLYQINFQVPDDAADGSLPLIVTQEGVNSNPTTLPVKRP